MRGWIQTNLEITPELERLLAATKERMAQMSDDTEAMLREQRVSFAYGNLPHKSSSTKDGVRRTASKIGFLVGTTKPREKG